jgi:hypothetical protein
MMGRELRLASMLAALLLACGQAAGAAPASTDWIADARGCKLANPRPQAIESVKWSGACKDGYAEGPGMVRWASSGRSNGTTSGSFRRGKLFGRGYVVLPHRIHASVDPSIRQAAVRPAWPSGSRLEGEFADNELVGEGIITMANGRKVVVTQIRGRLVRKHAAPSVDQRARLTAPQSARRLPNSSA